MVSIELSKVELRHLRDILAEHSANGTHTNAGIVSLNALLRRVGAEPRSSYLDEYFPDVEAELLPKMDEPDPAPGFLVKAGELYVARHGWTARRDCADVFTLKCAKWRREFELKDGYFRGVIEIVPAEGVRGDD